MLPFVNHFLIPIDSLESHLKKILWLWCMNGLQVSSEVMTVS